MGLTQEPFRKYNVEEKQVKDIFTVRLNEEERKILNICKKLIHQPKDSTCLKTLAWIGSKVIHEDKMTYLIDVVSKNKRNNERSGIVEIE